MPLDIVSRQHQFTGSEINPIHPVEPLPLHMVSTGAPKVGLALMVGSFGMLLTFLWLKICRLTASLQRREQRIQSLLAIDPLTSLGSRDRLCQVGEQLLLAHPAAEVALLSINLDRFKTINEGFGHQIGDELLRQVGHRIQACIAPQDTLARMGNDEFSLLLAPQPLAAQPSSTGAASSEAATAEAATSDRAKAGERCPVMQPAQPRAKSIAQQILQAIHQPFFIQLRTAGQSQTITISASVGIAIAPPASLAASLPTHGRYRFARQAARHSAQPVPQRDFSQLLSQANAAMTQVKKAKARRRKKPCSYLIFQPEMAVQRVAAARLRQDIQQAIRQQELCVRYQPIVDLKTAQPVGFEALVRWQHPTLGLLSPNYFLPIAEEMGLMVDIDRQVMEMACQQLLSWQTQKLQATLSVNLSGSHLGRTDLVSTIKALLARYSIDPARLNLEVTEGVMIAEPTRAIAALTQLRKMGLNVSLDDFGTGYCSFGYLQQFPVDILKIDKSFVSGLLPPDHPPNQDNIIVESLLTLSERLGIRVVAEGIERDDQYHQLQQLRCAYGQGNFFAEPMSPEHARDLLQQAQQHQHSNGFKRVIA